MTIYDDDDDDGNRRTTNKTEIEIPVVKKKRIQHTNKKFNPSMDCNNDDGRNEIF